MTTFRIFFGSKKTNQPTTVAVSDGVVSALAMTEGVVTGAEVVEGVVTGVALTEWPV